jgi:hypothetical protein
MFGFSALLLAAAVDNPCALVVRADINKVYGWRQIKPGVRKSYHLPAADAYGELCTYDSLDGSLVVTIGQDGAGLPNNDATNGLAPVRGADSIKVAGLPTDIGPDQVVVHYRGHDYGVSVQFVDAQFSNEQALKDLAKMMIARLRGGAHTAKL